MNFTRSEALAKAMGLRVGDRIKLKDKVYKVIEDYRLQKEESDTISLLQQLVDPEEELKIIEPRNKVKELTCDEIGCEHCGIRKMGHCCSYKQFIR